MCYFEILFFSEKDKWHFSVKMTNNILYIIFHETPNNAGYTQVFFEYVLDDISVDVKIV